MCSGIFLVCNTLERRILGCQVLVLPGEKRKVTPDKKNYENHTAVWSWIFLVATGGTRTDDDFFRFSIATMDQRPDRLLPERSPQAPECVCLMAPPRTRNVEVVARETLTLDVTCLAHQLQKPVMSM